MSTQILRMTGGVTITPETSASGNPPVSVPIDETVTIQSKLIAEYSLGADPAETVSLGDMASPGIDGFFLRASAEVVVRVTSADGTTQAIPATFLAHRCTSPITAMTVQRRTGVATTVFVTLWQEP